MYNIYKTNTHPLMKGGAKFILVMKLTTLLLFVTILQVSATSFGQNVTLKEVNSPIRKVFEKIRSQTGYDFLVTRSVLRNSSPVNISVDNKQLLNVLNEIFEHQNLSYNIKDGSIIITRKKVLMPLPAERISFFADFSGRVVGEDGLPIVGATIMVKGSTIGVVTDKDGKFTIRNIDQKSVLIVSYIGYASREIAARSLSQDPIRLMAVVSSLNDIAIVGYGTQKKSNLTGAISTVKMDEVLGNRPVSSTASLLQGTVPGLRINIGSGEPGAGPKFNIRGATDISTTGNTINSGSPLILVDNVPFNGSLNLLDPNDIETVTVLKDAGAAAIYGGRSAYGVILITSKKGMKNQKVQVSYNNNITFVSPQNLPVKPTPLQTVQSYKDMGTIGYWSGQNVDTWLNLLKDYESNPSKYADGYAYVSGVRYPLAQTDVLDDFLGNSAVQQMHNLSITGGSEKSSYRISAGLTDEPGILAPETKQDSYKRYNIKSFISSDITSWLTAQVDAGYAKSTKKFPNSVDQFGQAANLPSYVALKDTITATNGTRGINGTPRQLVGLGSPTVTGLNDLRLTARAIAKPLRGLTLTGEYTYENLTPNETFYNKIYSFVNTGNFQLSNGGTGVYRLTNEATDYKALNIFGNYSRSLGNHNLELLLGFNQESNATTQVSVQRDGMIAGELPSLTQATGPTIANNSENVYSLRGYFGRFNYNYKGRYLLEFNSRYDGSSKFPLGHRWGFFPSASAGWKISEESFMQDLKPFLNDFKLRGSFGEVGNQNIDPYQFVAVLSGYNPQWLNGTTSLLNSLNPPGLISSNFTWAKVRTLNLGIDFGLFNNKLTGSFEWYQRDTKDILAPGEIPLPAVLGTGAPLQNTAAVRSKGYEIQINWKDKIGSVSYRLGLNLYDSQGEVTKFDGNSSNLLSKYYVGQKTGEIWGYTSDRLYTSDDFVNGTLNANLTGGTLKPGVVKFQGQNPNPGDMMYKDLDNNGIIFSGNGTLANPGDRSIIGNSTPRYQYGILGGLTWKNFDFSFAIAGVGKQDLWLANPLTLPNQYAFGTLYAHQLDYWVPSRPDAFFGRIYDQAAGNQGFNQQLQTRYLLNGAYLRVKNLSLSYSVSQELIQRLHLSKLSVFCSVENPVTFQHLPKGLDPAIDGKQYGLGYPFMRMTSIGLNLSF